MRKCVRCGKRFEDTVEYKGKRYCKECYDNFLLTKASCSICKKSYVRKLEYTSDDMDNKDKKKNFCSKECYHSLLQDRLDMDELDNWLKAYHKTDKLNNRIYMQIQQFKSKNSFTTKGIKLTLEYITGTLKKELDPETIGIVSWYYDSAKNEYIKKINRINKAKDVQNLNTFEEKTIVFKPVEDSRANSILISNIDFNGGFDDV